MDRMTTPPLLGEIDMSVQELRLAKRHSEFTRKLAHVVSARQPSPIATRAMAPRTASLPALRQRVERASSTGAAIPWSRSHRTSVVNAAA